MNLHVSEVRGFEGHALYEDHIFDLAKNWLNENINEIREMHREFENVEEATEHEKQEIVDYLMSRSSDLYFKDVLMWMLRNRKIELSMTRFEFLCDAYKALRVLCQDTRYRNFVQQMAA